MTIKAPLAFSTKLGRAYCSKIEDFVSSTEGKKLRGKVNLILTSPPFPLAAPKAYGNKQGEEYRNWIVDIAISLKPLLAEDGSLVMEIGNAWDKGQPTMSLLPLQTLMAIAEEADYNVCQQFIWENTAKLPGPAPYVTRTRIRLKDSHTNIWWFSPVTRPKANNKEILTPYKEGQKKLMARGSYNHGMRPSEHKISVDGFTTNNGGAIMGSTLSHAEDISLIQDSVIRMSNTQRDKGYYEWCTKNRLVMHPARMPVSLAKLFIKFLTDEGDLVLDPFGGSCTTGQAAEELKRTWVAVEMDNEYLKGAQGRFSL